MKKLKLRAREVKKLGYKDEEDIRLVIQIVHKHYVRSAREEVYQILKDLLSDPSAFHNDPLFKLLAERLTGTVPKKPLPSISCEVKLTDERKDYRIFGSEIIEKEAIDQMDTAMHLPVTVAGALMADAHSGYGLPIGGVLATRNAIIPFGVGMDIGCRMCLSVYDLPPVFIENNRKRLKNILIENTRFGHNEFTGKKEHPVLDREEFSAIGFLRELKDKAYNQLGTSGHGNHFVDIGIVNISENIPELDLLPGEYVGILSHSGSRNMGASIAQHYTNLAKRKRKLPKGAINLAWLDLDEEEGHEYWQAMNLAGDYSAANHHIIHEKLAAALAEKPMVRIENHHNFAWKEKLNDGTDVIIHRKGATPARDGLFGIIPGSMISPGFIAKGKGNAGSLWSASHGAGRSMSRTEAKTRFTPKQLKEILARAGVELIGGGPDEAPGAYKDIHTIMHYQKDLVDIAGVFYPKIVRMSDD
ncbi:MAG: RtcB family protein [Bacteroidales bacterium]|nr:RtcB family protein [Bacteroidales bacterium]